MQCRNCSGNEFRKTAGGNYKCGYCGTLYYEEKEQSNLAAKFSRKAVLSAGTGVLALTFFLLLVMVKPWGKTVEEAATGAADVTSTFNNIENLQS